MNSNNKNISTTSPLGGLEGARKIDSIILHCSATPEGKDFKAADIDRWHRQRGFKSIGYHYIIDIDGTLEIGRPEAQVGAHCKGHNAHSIGICYIGGTASPQPSPTGEGVENTTRYVAKDTRTEAQKKAMNNLVRALMTKYHLTLANVHCHNEYAKKACPCFRIEDFRNSLDLI